MNFEMNNGEVEFLLKTLGSLPNSSGSFTLMMRLQAEYQKHLIDENKKMLLAEAESATHSLFPLQIWAWGR